MIADSALQPAPDSASPSSLIWLHLVIVAAEDTLQRHIVQLQSPFVFLVRGDAVRRQVDDYRDRGLERRDGLERLREGIV